MFRLLLLLLLLAPLAGPARAQTCSPYKGQVTINELRVGQSGKSSTLNQIELHNGGNVAAAVWKTWQLVVYSQRTGRTASKRGGYYLSSGFVANGAFVHSSGKSIYLRNRASRLVDVALVDASGAFIDYVAVEGRIQSVPACLGTPVVVDVTANSDTSADVARSPDGGAWPARTLATTAHTIGASNTCTPSGSDLVVDLAVDPSNPIATVTPTTYTLTVSNKSCSGSIAGIVVSTSGIHSGSFSNLGYSPSQGSTSQGASALTWNVGSLAAGALATLGVTGKPRSVGSLVTTASRSAPGSGLVNTGDDSSTETLTMRDRNYVGFVLLADEISEGLDTSYSALINSTLVASSPITVRYAVSGSTLATDTSLLASGTVTIDPSSEDSTEASIDFTIRNDLIAEATKTLRLTITSVSSADAQVALDPAEAVMDITLLDDDSAGPHHLELRHASGRGLSCMPDSVSVVACQDAACTTPHVGGVTGTLAASHAATLWPAGPAFVIPAGASSTSVALQLPVAGSTTLAVAASLPAGAAAASCNFGSPACSYTAEDSGLLATVSNHVAESSQTLGLRAVRKADNSTACVAALAGTTRTLQFACRHVDPASGSKAVRVGGRALNAGADPASACDGRNQALNLSFDAAGLASTTLQYADAGLVELAVSYAGSEATRDLGLSLAGTTRFVAAPARFAFGGLPGGTVRAGTPFAATLSALNEAGAVMPNFGREAVAPAITLRHVRAQPTGSGASDGVFSGSLGAFANGTASASNLVWSEVGRIDLVAQLTDYLGSGLGVAGSTGSAGAVGRFVPARFELSATPACGVFSYAGQPFGVTLRALNGLATPGVTLNYDGSAATSPNFARAVTLSDTALGSLGSFSGHVAAAGAFRAGTATLATPAYSYTDKLTGPRSLRLRASDSDGVSSAGGSEPEMPLRSGRLRVFNAYGPSRSALSLPVQLQYWSGSAWVLNAEDSCSSLPAAAIVPVAHADHRGAPRAAWGGSIGALGVAAGQGRIAVAAPPEGVSGSLDLAINLGSGTVDASCLASHPASIGAAKPWLRARNGSCASDWTSDPSARLSFGIAAPESRRTMHVREVQ